MTNGAHSPEHPGWPRSHHRLEGAEKRSSRAHENTACHYLTLRTKQIDTGCSQPSSSWHLTEALIVMWTAHIPGQQGTGTSRVPVGTAQRGIKMPCCSVSRRSCSCSLEPATLSIQDLEWWLPKEPTCRVACRAHPHFLISSGFSYNLLYSGNQLSRSLMVEILGDEARQLSR